MFRIWKHYESLCFRGENTNDEFRYLKRENGTTQNISTGGGTLIATYTFTGWLSYTI